MESLFTRILRPVKRQGAERYLRMTLLAFAISVVVTRLFLSMTGYPQVGGGDLHIAHLLWGGLLLFVAALLPLMFANRWVYTVGGVLSGVGVGLFIDEVGKFITRNNNYFYPAAAPIIYAFFLITVLLYLRVRRPPASDPRAELYRIFDDMSEVLDHDLDPREQADLEARLKAVAGQTAEPDDAQLAQVLLAFLQSDTACRKNPVPGPVARFLARARDWEMRTLTRPRFRALLVAGLVLVGLFSLAQLGLLAIAASAPAAVSPEARVAAGLAQPGGSQPSSAQPDDALLGPDDQGAAQSSPAPGSAASGAGAQVSPTPAASQGGAPSGVVLPNRPVRPAARTAQGRVAFWLRAGLEALVGLLLLVAAYFLLARRERSGIVLGGFTLLLALTTLNLLVFYFDQFAAVVDALVQFGLYQAIVHYRHRYL